MACNNKIQCSCTYTSCSHHGKCCECIDYHRKLGEVPGCLFSKQGEKTYDRSIDMLYKDSQSGKN